MPLPDTTQHSQEADIHAPAGFEPVIPASEQYSPYGFTLVSHIFAILQYEIVKSGRILADDCKISVGLGRMYNDKIKRLYCKVKLLNNT
jgi:hypothetical protein